MANSKRYLLLINRLKTIDEFYLPKPKISGNYTKREIDDTRAYVLLVHAEIESYFEEVTIDKFRAVYKTWDSNRKKSSVLLSLLAFCETPLTNKLTKNNLHDRVNHALTSHINNLKKNHGIKEQNILDMLLPLGIEYKDIDPTWLKTIDSFGADRGMIAHNTASVQKPLDPITLKSTVTLIMTEVQNIDIKIKDLK